MGTIQKRFNSLGIVLTLTIVIGLIVQYMYFNNIVAKEKQKNLITIREHLAESINHKMNSYNQYINISAEIIGTNNWTDEELIEYVTRLAKSNRVIKSIYYGDINNKLINSDNWEPAASYDVRTRPWYMEAVKKGELAISDVYASAIDGGTIISVSKTVYDENKVFMGVVSADIAVEEIIKIVETTRVQGSGYSFLIDGAGNILAHPKYKYNIGSGLINIDSLGPEIHKEIKTMKSGQMETKLDGVEGYLTYRSVEDTNWTIGNFISFEHFKDNNNELWRMFFIVIIIAIIIFLSFTSIQRKNFLIPLLKLDEDIRKIDLENNIAYRIPLEIKDPFIGIKKALNTTLSKTQELVEQVEQDKEEILEKNENLNYLSYNDQLTGIYNRRYFEEQLQRLDVQETLPITLVMGDANGLKLINDSFGHKAGDNLLIAISDVMNKSCRVGDIVCRISGDEFVIILPRTDKKGAELVIDRIKQLSQEKKVSTDQFSNIEISVSYGFATKYDMKTNMLDILKNAEDNMYSNKLFDGPEMRKRTIKIILEELYKRDKNKKNHSQSVAKISKEIGIELGMKQEELQELVMVGEIHDIGEIAVGKEILNKKEKLTSEEWAEIKKHPEIGYRILNTISEMSNLAYYVLSHHERYDGMGYPKGLKGEEIPLVSRIVTIANAYDAMRSNRPYRKALCEDEIVREFAENAGTQFDPELSKLFVEKILKREWV
ncbi:MAG TPA: diguanylate cyclase [Epulopiscium sp.]|nr:diguanylate cyclase [Candidatus Epulonipiscium sp.]